MRRHSSYRVIAGGALLLALGRVSLGQSQWDHPAADLAGRIAEILGPGQVHLTLRNLSSISNDDLTVIRRLLEDDLKTSGISLSNADSAVRVTLSENPEGGLWVAEIEEGNETRVVMQAVDLIPVVQVVPGQKATLHKQLILRDSDLLGTDSPSRPRKVSQILAVADAGSSMIVLTPERVAVFSKSPQGWAEQGYAELGAHPGSRDPRGVIFASADGASFTAFAPGVACSGALAGAVTGTTASWTIHCHASDDPWPMAQSEPDQGPRAFYNSGRDYFTGVVTTAPGAALPPFYDAGLLPGRSGGTALLIGGTDGKVTLVESGQLKTVSGTRDWGSDFAVIAATCDAPAHVIVSSSGEGAGDSLKAYELSSLDAVPVSDELMLGGAAMVLETVPDRKSTIVVVRTEAQPGQEAGYEVDRVSESCN